MKDAGVFGEKAEDKPGHEMVHVVAARGGPPILIGFQQFNIEFVETAGGADIDWVVADLPDGADASERQEKAEMVWEISKETRDKLTGLQFFGFEGFAVGCEDEFNFVAGVVGGGALAQFVKGGSNLVGAACLDVDVVGLQDAADVGFVGGAVAQAFEGGRFAAKSFDEPEGKFGWIERLFNDLRDGLFDFDGVQMRVPLVMRRRLIIGIVKRALGSAATKFKRRRGS